MLQACGRWWIGTEQTTAAIHIAAPGTDDGAPIPYVPACMHLKRSLQGPTPGLGWGFEGLSKPTSGMTPPLRRDL